MKLKSLSFVTSTKQSPSFRFENFGVTSRHCTWRRPLMWISIGESVLYGKFVTLRGSALDFNVMLVKSSTDARPARASAVNLLFLNSFDSLGDGESGTISVYSLILSVLRWANTRIAFAGRLRFGPWVTFRFESFCESILISSKSVMSTESWASTSAFGKKLSIPWSSVGSWTFKPRRTGAGESSWTLAERWRSFFELKGEANVVEVLFDSLNEWTFSDLICFFGGHLRSSSRVNGSSGGSLILSFEILKLAASVDTKKKCVWLEN